MIAGRYLMPGKNERFIFLVATISLIAVALGVAALIAVMSVMNGFRAELFDRIQGLNGHAVAQGYGGRLADWRTIVEEARKTPGVTAAIPLVEQPLMATHEGRVEGVLVRGMTVDDITHTAVIADNVKSGSLDRLKEGEPVAAIGARLAENLGVVVGDRIALISPDGNVTPFGAVPRIVSYEVGAIFEIGVYDYDKAFVLLPMGDAQTLLRLGDDVGMIEITTTDPDKVGQILAPLQKAMGGRALANRPVLVLADEPTGNLDEGTATKVLDAFLALVRQEGSAALVATHNRQLAARMDRVVELHEGRLA